MADVFAEIDEAMKQEKLQNLWEKYGGFIIGVLVLVILATAGNEIYKNWAENKNLKQTEHMLVLLEGDNKSEIIKQAQELQTGLKGLTMLNVAGDLARQGKTEEAFEIYKKMAVDNALPREVRAIADFMVLRLMMSVKTGQEITPEKIISGLEKIWNNPDSPLRYHARLEAAVILAENIRNYDDAKKQLQFLISEKSVPDSLKQKAVSLDVLYGLKNTIKTNEEEKN
ncbi:MAG: hypothetical protein OEY94_04940 [Alphaproteobacteria bacterium]|nr:hypothetical protein [Alphaproteobacteria bacterium]